MSNFSLTFISPGMSVFPTLGLSFPLDIRWYGLLIAIGAALGIIIGARRAPIHGITADSFFDFVLIGVPIGVIGARLYYVAFNWSNYSGDFMKIINFRLGGLAIHGGLIFGILAVLLVCRFKHENFWNIADLAVPLIALGQCLGRWGNFFNEEAHGSVTNFPISVLIDGTNYHATFFYESVWCLLLFIILSIVEYHRGFNGQVFCLYCILYSFERFFVEILRTDSLILMRIAGHDIKQAMVLSAVVFIAGIICYSVLKQREYRKGRIFVSRR